VNPDSYAESESDILAVLTLDQMVREYDFLDLVKY
jgi:hypothetical protein